ncbi:MAG: hypothetical protein ACTSU4_13185 [Promethearchaeota archaeon]
MRIRKRKTLPRRNALVVVLFFIPVLCVLSYLGLFMYILYDISSYNLEMPPPKTEYFYDLNEINENTLDKLAHTYEYQLKYHHSPAYIPVDVTFKDSTYTSIDYWHGTDNGALHLGYALAAECHRYKAALREGDIAEANRALIMVERFVTGFSYMLAAPNGGIGPDYPGTPARFVCSPENRKYHPFIFEEHPRHFNGTGEYKDWRVRLYTSRDEIAGYYLGFASVLSCIDPELNEDSKWCVDRIKLLTAQLIEGFKNTNWLVLGGEGEPVGSDLNTYLTGSTWQLALLRIGATAYPEKYESLYQYCAAKTLSAKNANMGSLSNTLYDTYALAFSMDVMYSLIILEDDPGLRYYYIKSFENGFYNFVRYHRNAYFNIIHLIFMELLSESERVEFNHEEYNDDMVRWDVLDQLWRFQASGWDDGVRNLNLRRRPHSTRWSSENPDIRRMEKFPRRDYWANFFENNSIGNMYLGIKDEFGFDKEMYKYPLTISECAPHYFLWEHSKFFGMGADIHGNGLTQAVPTSFLTVYWMARAFDII